MKKKRFKNERYSIIITCDTDARKKPASFSFMRKTVLICASVFVLTVTVCAAIAIVSSSSASFYSDNNKALKSKADNQLKAIDSYKGELNVRKEELVDWRMYERMYGNE